MKLFNKISVVTFLLSLVFCVLSFAVPNLVHAVGTVPELGNAENFSVLAALSAASANLTTIAHNLGLSPGIASDRTGPWNVLGTESFGPAPSLAFDAQADSLTAFNHLRDEPSDGTWSLNPTPAPGVWTAASSATFAGPTLTLNGDYNDVWVFQIGQDFTFNGTVVMAGNAQPCNVFWQIGRDATITSGSTLIGTLIASRDVVVASGATVNGRIISLNGALTVDANTISGPTCVAPPAPPAPATLHVIKLVVGGAAAPADFNVHVTLSGSEVAGSPQNGAGGLGTLYTLAAGTYKVDEDVDPLYTKSFVIGDCDVNGNVTLVSGQDYICTLINTANVIPPVAPSSSGGGGGSRRIVPLIGILKVPSPLALPGGAGAVTYDYTVWNVGRQEALDDVTVTDDKCSQINLLSGDTNNNAKLDPDEIWKYRCNTTLTATTTNTAIATGYSDDSSHEITIATAIATVVVGTPINPPLIDIVKIPSQLTPFSVGGGNVAYTYTVTNPGIVPLNDVTVVDDKCSPIIRTSSDPNGNELLDPGEVWMYSCQTNISVSTRNVATATGEANGLIAIDYAFATVLVNPSGFSDEEPGLPNTGIGYSYQGSLPWGVILPSGIMLAIFSFYVAKKKRLI